MKTTAFWIALAPMIGCSFACHSNQTSSQTTETFATPEDAMREVAALAESGDSARAEQVLGVAGAQLLETGDETADREDGARLRQAIDEHLEFADDGAQTKVALVGADEWPFPIPLVADHGRWRFDVDAGLDELATRRIGQNELMTLATLHECVSAQQEYFAQPREGAEHSYARTVCSAAREGDDADEASAISHGYYFRCLDCQGKHAPGGEQKYANDRGLLTRGFAILAWPAKYGESGVMTFQVNQRGLVFQKDLGASTNSTVAAITCFDPDESWDPTGD